MTASATPAATPTPVGRIGRSRFEILGATLLGLALWISYRTERRIFHDSRTVTVITNVRTKAEQAEARRNRDPRDDIAEIYGVPVGSPLTVVPPKSRSRAAWIAPDEDPNRRLLPLSHLARFDKPASVRLVGHGIALGVAATGLAAFAFGRRRRLRSANATPSPDAARDARPSPPP